MAVIEVTAFALSGDEEQFLSADARMQTDFAYQQPGLLRRTTARGDGGSWLVLSLWADMAAAEAAERAGAHDDVARAFWACVDGASVRTKRFTTLE